MKRIIDEGFLEALERFNIFQARTGMNQKATEYKNRFKVGGEIEFHPSTVIESYSTIAAGNRLFSMGAFSALASSLTYGSTVGRYVEVASHVNQPKFRHPYEAVTINSAAFNFFREYTNAYYKSYQENNSVSLDLNSISTPQPQKKPIKVGSDVWIAGDVVLKGGVDIGNGAIVASGSYVNKNVPPYAIVGGYPAKVIKYRFPKEIIDELESSTWWDYELGDMQRLGFDFSNPVSFLKQISDKGSYLRKLSVERFSPLLHFATGDGRLSKSGRLITSAWKVLCYNSERSLFYQSEVGLESSEDIVRLSPDGGFLVHSSGGYVCRDKDGFFIDGSPSERTISVKFEVGDKVSLYVPFGGGCFVSAGPKEVSFKKESRAWESFLVM